MRKSLSPFIIIVFVLFFLTGLLLALTIMPDSLVWWLASSRARIEYAVNPPGRVVFTPGAQTAVIPTPSPIPSLPSSPVVPVAMATVQPSLTSTIAPTPSLTPTALPASAQLDGILHMYQMMNNCGPANLAMALTFWGWKGDQRDTAAFLKPNKQDKNVMPYEMEAYIEQETDLAALVRVGGDLTMLKAFVSAGFPVIAEKGYEGATFEGWMGHYQVVNGFDDAKGVFFVQDSYKGPNLSIPYEDFINQWRDFNYTFLVIYPPERRQQVVDILGMHAYENYNDRQALQKSVDESQRLSGRDLFFALYNQGTNLVRVQDYTAAAKVYDAAFANYQQIPEEQRPWRMMWYQTGPYFAYYYTGRFQDVIDLATTTLANMSGQPILEESFYWRALAKIALAQYSEAEEDLRQCLEVHEGFTPCEEELQKLGVEP